MSQHDTGIGISYCNGKNSTTTSENEVLEIDPINFWGVVEDAPIQINVIDELAAF